MREDLEDLVVPLVDRASLEKVILVLLLLMEEVREEIQFKMDQIHLEMDQVVEEEIILNPVLLVVDQVERMVMMVEDR